MGHRLGNGFCGHAYIAQIGLAIDAAFTNGVMGHIEDFDDSGAHPASYLTPTVLSRDRIALKVAPEVLRRCLDGGVPVALTTDDSAPRSATGARSRPTPAARRST